MSSPDAVTGNPHSNPRVVTIAQDAIPTAGIHPAFPLGPHTRRPQLQKEAKYETNVIMFQVAYITS